jgi:hypothetical protein
MITDITYVARLENILTNAEIARAKIDRWAKAFICQTSSVFLLVSRVRKTVEEKMNNLLSKYTYPPVEVVIPILEKAGRGEEELASQIHETDMSVLTGLMKTLNLKEKNMRTVAKMFGVLLSYYGQKYEPLELSENRFCLSVSDCPMLHVGKNVGTAVKSKFCDLLCSSAAKAMATLVLGEAGSCSWDKALIKGGRKCTVAFELVKTK